MHRFIFPFLVLLLCPGHTSAQAFTERSLESVVSVLPVWPGHAQGGGGSRPGQAPEGSGVVLEPNIVATSWHVVEPATRIDVRLSDGRILPARFLARDEVSDIAVLQVDAALKPFSITDEVQHGQPVCAVGNAFGLGLSVSCGVVSAKQVSDGGFNAVEDFVQTDAAANPGSSGGALVDQDGNLVGMMSAIFASSNDTNIGINFAISSALLQRVANALVLEGEVTYPRPGWQLARADRAQLADVAAPVVRSVDAGSPAQAAGIVAGDLILDIGKRRVQSPRDAIAALAVLPETVDAVDLRVRRGAEDLRVSLPLKEQTIPEQAEAPVDADCPHPVAICDMRQAVFPLAGYGPVGSATRIGPDLMVTNRHLVGNADDVIVHTPDGPNLAEIVPSGYGGDLVLLKVTGLPKEGFVPSLDQGAPTAGTYFVVGVDVGRRQVRVFDPGPLIALPAAGARLGRIHVAAQMQPGVSGGALFDSAGKLAGIAVGGGDGRFEAIPIADVAELLQRQNDPEAARITSRLGVNLAACDTAIEATESGPQETADLEGLTAACARAANHGQLLNAGRILARAGDFDGAIRLHGQASEQVPNSINSRMSLLVSLQLAGRFQEMTEHARYLMQLAPDDPQALRFSIQSGVWGDEPELAEEGYQALLKADPRQAQAARRFIDNAPPAPPRR